MKKRLILLSFLSIVFTKNEYPFFTDTKQPFYRSIGRRLSRFCEITIIFYCNLICQKHNRKTQKVGIESLSTLHQR